MMQSLAPSREYEDQQFENIQFERGHLFGSRFSDCQFIHCSFEAAELVDCRFSNCSFQECNLSLAKTPGSSFPSTRFLRSKLIGIDWTQANWPTTGFARHPEFQECVISHSTFIGLKLQGIEIKDCIAHETDFRQSDLSDAGFEGRDLDKSLFLDTNLTGADLSRARNYPIDPGSNILKNAKFSMPEALALLHNMDIVLTDETDHD